MRFALAALLLASAVPAMAAPAKPAEAPQLAAPARTALTAALADPRRAADRERDVWRNPAETLAFFRVAPGMTVIDFMPAGGWYTRVLAPYLGEQGRYIGLNPDVSKGSERQKTNFGNLSASFPPKAAEWTGIPAERIAAFNSDAVPATLDGSVDRVLIFREMHNLWRSNWLTPELTTMRRLLKSDGLLGIEQHRAKPGAPFEYANGTKGYLREGDVIALVEAHGFELVARSEINANPKDPADHAAGVWSLAPNFSQKDVDRARYASYGESDRMTLLFRKRP